MAATTVVLVTLAAYKVALIAIGLWAYRRNRSATDFFLAGRKLGPWLAGLSYAASTSSAWVLLGFSGFVYGIGVSALWMVPGIWAGYAVVWLYFGPRLQEESARYRQVSLTDFLLQDAPDGSARRTAAVVAALLIVVCFVFYTAAQFDAAGKALVSHLALTTAEALLIGAVIVTTYALMGGFWAVSATDSLQAVVMLIIAIGVPWAALDAAGGWQATLAVLAREAPAAYLSLTGGHAPLLFLGFVVGVIGMSLGALGQPQLMSRLMAIEHAAERRLGFAIAITWGVVVFTGMVVLGLSGRALLPVLANGEVLFYQAAATLLPPLFAGVVIAATLSAVMSTVDSILLAASAAVAHDTGLNRRFPERALLVSRCAMLLVSAAAVALALLLPDTIFNRVLFAWSALGAAFGPILLWRVRGKPVGAHTALAGMLLGFATTVLFYLLGATPADDSLLATLAHLPGDPFERVFGWLPPIALLAAAERTAAAKSTGRFSERAE